MSDTDLGYTFSVMLDPASITAITNSIRKMLLDIRRVGESTAKSVGGDLDKALKTSMRSGVTEAKKLTGAVHDITDEVERMEKIWLHSMSQVQQQYVSMAHVLDQIIESEKLKAATVRASGSIERQERIQTRETAAAASRRAVAEIRAEGNMRVVEAQNAGVAAKEAAKLRIVVTQNMMAQLTRMEKALGAVIAGTAKTAVAAISKTFSGIGSALSRVFGRSSVSMKQLDKQMTAGVSGSLRQRENLMRQSFTRQEQIISRSAMRQQAALTGLRTSTQTGVVGAANRSLNIGAWVGGAALLMAVRSTFTIGSEFTRGMAVLQAQLNLTDQAMQDVHDTAIQLGNDITLPGVSALDAAEAIQLLTKQFAALGDEAVIAAQDAAKGTLQLARAAGVGAEEAAQIVGAAVNVFGVAASQATAVADQVAAALKNAAGVSFQDFSDAFKQSAAVFAQFQVPALGAAEALVQFDTALAVIARQGVVGSDAGTSLKQFFLQANRNVAATQNALLELTQRAGEVGTAFYDAAGKARPLEETLDILRRGLVGYTDQQRNAALQTIFGSDAIRVANALLGTSTEEYAKVVQAMREQGLAAKIAAAQNTGLKGALDALKSVIQTIQILIYEKLNPILGEIVLTITELANAVFFGAGAFEVLRKALIGAAIGMGAIIAAKAAVEVIRMLGIAAKLALTPFGALLVAAGLLGAAIAVLSDSSEPFRNAIKEIGAALEPVVATIKDAVTGAFEALGRLINEVVIPALTTAAVWLAEHILPAFEAVRNFIVNTFIPAVEDLASSLVDVLGGALDWVVEKAKSLWHALEQFLRPTIDAVHELINAIGAFFTGGASQIADAAVGVVKGIAATLDKIWDAIFESIKPFLDRAWAAIKDFFSVDNLKKLAIGFLVIVEEFGRILGLIVSDPIVYKAIAAVGVAAAAIALAFVKGFISGVIENLPELWDLLTSAFKKGLELAFQNLPLVLGGILALWGLKRLVKGFSAIGAEAGKAFTGGFKGQVATARGFLTTLVSGVPQFGNLNAQATEVQNLRNQLRILESPLKVSFDKRSIAAAKSEVGKLTKGLTDGQLAALRMRDAIMLNRLAVGEVARGVAGIGRGFSTAIGGIVQALGNIKPLKSMGNNLAAFFSNDIGNPAAYKQAGSMTGIGFMSGFGSAIKSGTQQISAAWGQMMDGLREVAAAKGTTIGRMVGSAFGVAAIAAASAAGGFVAGRAEGASGGSGLLSALIGGVSAGAMVGGPWGAAVGVITGGAALIGAAFGKASADAKKFKENLNNIKDTIRGPLVDALKSGELAVIDLKSAFSGPVRVDLEEQIFNLLSPETRTELQKLGIGIDEVMAAFEAGPEAVAELGNKIRELGGITELTIMDGTNSTVKAAAEVDTVFQGLQATMDQIAADKNFAPDQFAPTVAMNDLAGATSDVAAGIGELTPALQEVADANKKAFDESVRKVERYQEVLDAAYRALKNMFSFSFQNPMEQIANDAIIAAEDGGKAMAEAVAEGTAVGAAEAKRTLDEFGSSIYDVIQAGVADGMILTPADAMRATAAIRDTFIAGLDPTDPAQMEIINQVNKAYGDAISNLQPALDTISIATEAQKFEEQFQQFLTDHPFQTEVRARVSLSTRNRIQNQFDTGYTGFSEVKAGQLLKKMDETDDLVSQFVPVGEDMGNGIIIGLKNIMPKVKAAAWELAMSAKRAAQAALVSYSPSRVFMKLGTYIGDGLALGIDNSAGKVADSARSAAQGAIDAARAMSGDIGLSMSADINGLRPAAYVSQQGRAAAQPAPQGMTASEIVRLARAIAAESKPNVNIDQTFNEKVDSRAVASDVAWRLR